MSQASASRHQRAGRRSAYPGTWTEWGKATGAVLAMGFASAGHAVEFGPDGMFSINGFGEVTLTVGNNQCPPEGCQLSPETDRQRIWADAVVPGRKLSTDATGFSQVQLWLGAKYDLGGGFKVKGTLSQNWRDGKVDTPGFVREQNIAVSHEDYGTLTAGETVSRTWQFADFPFGSNLGLSSAWAGTGAGYRNLRRAIRYTSPVLDVAAGDMVLEMTYDRGSSNFKVNKPSFYELWAHYGKGDLSIDAMYQDTRNGSPSAFGAAGFYAPFYDPAGDSRLGGSGQSMALLQAIYQYSPKIELSGAVRRNRWSGAYAVVALDGPPVQFNFPFNVDWGGTLNGVANPGYPARSTDLALGARYRMDKWTLSTGLVYIGKASTNNPSERGQSNSALVNTIGATYNYGNGWEASVFAGMIHYRLKGLSPLGMPSNATINAIDSRVTKAGNWFGVGIKYNF
jgi:predicted porin